ncbi:MULTISPECIES: carbohydrate ABC transporter permease [Microbacterium]|uniref:carbohydrate ABC transporter permease n=1 Tax=Microbacterium TaxID=33882 RepID=UPI0023DCC510|nr:MULTISPECIES: carbohydrate ABC transporter permease [Microbacterium]MDF2047647.1 carbohydrate ABC transporter permease [Microbacterium sp. Kw_RZR3]MDQ1074910.1 multiple sugar transport system permease protein [Microbacterium sp. SORGH_AS_0969]MDQ1115135.1 multiple sugar transport system permease protein [Microbacterium testaceum]
MTELALRTRGSQRRSASTDAPRVASRSVSRVRSSIGYALLILVALLFLSPLIFMVATSLKPPAEVFTSPPTLVGSVIQWSNYADVFDYAPFGRYLVNGMIVAIGGTLLTLVVSALSGYAFARLRFRGRGATFAVFLATMMLPQEVIIVPAFVLMRELGWVNSYQALIVPWAFTALGAFLLRQFFMTVPQELEDAARIDGAGTVTTFLRIMLPLARPTLAVLAVFTFITYWNSFLWPLIVVNDVTQLGTIPLGLQLFVGQQGTQWHLIMAASVISMLPTTVLLIVLQRYLIRGIVTSGLGGR